MKKTSHLFLPEVAGNCSVSNMAGEPPLCWRRASYLAPGKVQLPTFESILLLLYYYLFLDLIRFDCVFFLLDLRHFVENVTTTGLSLLVRGFVVWWLWAVCPRAHRTCPHSLMKSPSGSSFFHTYHQIVFSLNQEILSLFFFFNPLALNGNYNKEIVS